MQVLQAAAIIACLFEQFLQIPVDLWSILTHPRSTGFGSVSWPQYRLAPR
jgi:hypothetical protein